jgi:hypothetical protein
MIISGDKLKSFLLVLVLHILCLSGNTVSAQSTSSPYSRYGIGDVNNRVFGQGYSMGATSTVLQNDTVAAKGPTPLLFINASNPASYANTYQTTAELGLNYNRMRLQSEDSRKNVNTASFGYVAVALPLKKWGGASFGLIPFSSVGYNLVDAQEIPNVGTVDYTYTGSGGMSQAYFGLAFKPLYGLPKMFRNSDKYLRLKKEGNNAKIIKIMRRKKSLASLAFGANASYLFGNIQNERTSVFSTSSTFNTRTTNTTRFSDMYFDYGMQYAHTIDSIRGRDLKENVQLLFGATFAAQTDVNAKIDSLAVTYFHSQAGYDVVKDTVEFVEGHKGTVTLPLSFSVGIGFKKGTRWTVAADFGMQNWSSYQAFNQTQGLKNSMRFSLGAQYVPDIQAVGIKNYLKRINYRFGGRYAITALELKNSQLTEYALTLGIGLPVGTNYQLKSFSMVNIGVELGQRGTTLNGLVQEQFFRATLGFTINDRWFLKTKYD